ncbi:AraC-like DNA-binding protein [Nocardia sp. GAS34]|uniref:AraC family transcriptional regulator ligand-binding domain-containing protein n=1 Tax=unclassified Nocardia TaxID=2637762 RepID=UPI003D1EA7A5
MEAVDLILLPRTVLESSGLSPEVRHRLADEVGLSTWMLSSSDVMVPASSQLRLWERAEKELDDPHIALRIADTYRPGQMGLHDYLLITAPTLGQGLAVSRPYLGVVTTNYDFALADASEDEVSVDIRLLDGTDRGRELAMQYALMANVTRARRVTETAVNPVRVCLRQQAPRQHREFIEAFGTERIDFGAPTDRITFRTADLTLPLRTADPMLAAVLRRYAATQPKTVRAATWSQRLHEVLIPMLGDGAVSVDRAAREMVTSRRTLQRRLAEEGTTWRGELDRARRAVLETRSAQHRVDGGDMARELGYSDARALRRAHHRWSALGSDGS